MFPLEKAFLPFGCVLIAALWVTTAFHRILVKHIRFSGLNENFHVIVKLPQRKHFSNAMRPTNCKQIRCKCSSSALWFLNDIDNICQYIVHFHTFDGIFIMAIERNQSLRLNKQNSCVSCVLGCSLLLFSFKNRAKNRFFFNSESP